MGGAGSALYILGLQDYSKEALRVGMTVLSSSHVTGTDLPMQQDDPVVGA